MSSAQTNPYGPYQQVGPMLAPYQQVAPLTNQQQAGMQLVSDISGPVQNYLGNAMGTSQWLGSGALMSPNANPYLRGMYDAAAQGLLQNYQTAVAPNILQQAAQSGTLGSSGMAQGFQDAQSTLGQSLGDLASNLYGGAYARGLEGTLSAQSMTPALSQAQYTPAQNLLNVGQMGQQQAQNILKTGYGNLEAQAAWPFQALTNLGQGLGTAGGAQTVTVSPSQQFGK